MKFDIGKITLLPRGVPQKTNMDKDAKAVKADSNPEIKTYIDERPYRANSRNRHSHSTDRTYERKHDDHRRRQLPTPPPRSRDKERSRDK